MVHHGDWPALEIHPKMPLLSCCLKFRMTIVNVLPIVHFQTYFYNLKLTVHVNTVSQLKNVFSISVTFFLLLSNINYIILFTELESD